ncbi:Crp/Fnr family transcriptional regulator [Chitinophaga silvisoli]|uniref:Crp/Fnr family transcriptional regulator n=1 Tax=Chitinophaga silvisoli TaxID=2291814 RepID=A0A3E1P4D8_9BACT|nr:Crp/Fnr family transcriptional regulator [Chitinophaga silvisoli]RFM35045.1 Crp/Fnr family transcriptional regulator [Chitinophaga silvisoli]
MFEFFAKYLVEKGGFTESELELVRQVTVSKKIRKSHYLLEEGKVSDFIGFVTKGAFRLFRKGEDGQEYTMKFAVENWWISDFTSFLSGEQSNCYIEALENSELMWFSRETWDHLIATIPNFRRMIDKLTARNFEAHQNRIFSNISEPADTRYENFVNSYPTLYNRIPLYMIASFLGITRETLSRIRKQAAQRKTTN